MPIRKCLCSKDEIATIKRILAIPASGKFPLCPARDIRKLDKLNKMGDRSHWAPGHLCWMCRCSRTAGQGTRGDFYGLGEHTGHHGCGYCDWHERAGTYKAHGRRFAKQHMTALQTVGKAHERDVKDFETAVKIQAEESHAIREIRSGYRLVTDTIKEFQQKVKDKEPLTESSAKGPVQISDKARMELACKLAETITRLIKTSFDIESSNFISIDELRIRIPQMIASVYRYIPNQPDRDKWLLEFKNIWNEIKPTHST